MKTIIKNGTLINEGEIFRADILIENDIIVAIEQSIADAMTQDAEIIDATGQYVIPGVIDDQVHFREPGLTHKGTIENGSRAAAAGGVTSFMDMPNVVPPTTTCERLRDKQDIAAKTSLVNYSFYLGVTIDNLDEIKSVDPKTTCGLKIFMGSSTGNMLVDNVQVLEQIFAESPLLVATHCEDSPMINDNLARTKEIYGDNIPMACHPLIRSREACFKSSSLAVELARKHNTRLHILHLSTAEEIALLDKGNRKDKKITGEVCVHHLWFNADAYRTKGSFVKWNPAIKTEDDRKALLKAVDDGIIDVIATDHAPHTIQEKTGFYTQAASGGPMVQHSLIVMLELAERKEIALTKVIEGMCHAPAELFRVEKRGFLRKGYKADICIVKKEPHTIDKGNILYSCGWSPLEGMSFNYQVKTTLVNGHIVYNNGILYDHIKGEMLTFE